MKCLEERKFEAKYNKEQWEIKLLEGNQLSIRNKKTLDEPRIIFTSPDSILEQVSDNEFFMITSSNDVEEKELVVLNLSVPEDDEIDVCYERFTHCYAISDDLLLFKNETRDAETGELEIYCNVYSIKEGGILEAFEWLSQGYGIDPMVISNDDNENKVVLHVIKTIEADKAINYVQFLVDPVTFQPISAVYSSLRRGNIAVRSKQNVESIIRDDSQYMRIFESYFSEESECIKDEAKGIVLSKAE